MNKITVLLIIFVIGIIIVAFPDNDVRLFSISKDHGPSALDAAGLALIAVGYGGLVLLVWKQRHKILVYRKTPLFLAGALISMIGAATIILSVVGNIGNWWMIGAAILSVTQGVAFFVALK